MEKRTPALVGALKREAMRASFHTPSSCVAGRGSGGDEGVEAVGSEFGFIDIKLVSDVDHDAGEADHGQDSDDVCIGAGRAAEVGGQELGEEQAQEEEDGVEEDFFHGCSGCRGLVVGTNPTPAPPLGGGVH